MPLGERIAAISSGMVPGLSEVTADPGCIEQFFELETLETEHKAVTAELSSIPRAPMTRDEVIESHRDSYNRALARYAEGKLAKYAFENLSNPDPFRRIERMSFFHVAFPPWELYHAAIMSIPDAMFGPENEASRSKKTTKLKKRLAELEERITMLKCPPYIRIDRDGIMGDVRADFIHHWQRIQSRCSAACDYSGVELRDAEPWVRDLYVKLDLGKLVSSRRDALLPALR